MHSIVSHQAFVCLTLTGLASILILPQLMASSGRAPLSLPSNSFTGKKG